MAKIVQLSATLAACALLTGCYFSGPKLSDAQITKNGDGFEAAKRITDENLQAALGIINDSEITEAFTAKSSASRRNSLGSSYYKAGAKQYFEADDSYCMIEKIEELANRAHKNGWSVRIRPFPPEPGERYEFGYMVIAHKGQYRVIYFTALKAKDDSLNSATSTISQPSPTLNKKPSHCKFNIASEISCMNSKGQLCEPALNKNYEGTKDEYAWPKQFN